MTRTSKVLVQGALDAAVLDLVGADARRFCNSMFTNNARDLPVGSWQHSAMTDDRGRLQGLMTLHCLSDECFRVVLEGLSAEAFEERYRLFIVFDDVTIEPRPELTVVTLQGTGPFPTPNVPAKRSVVGGVDLWLEDLTEVPGEPAEPGELEWMRIEAGVVRWPVDASEKQLPHELGLRDTHLHFEKGCYRGQEIIHRVDVMGQVRKRLMGVRLPEVQPIGTDLLLEGKKVGRLGSSVVHPIHGAIGLAVVRNTVEPGQAVDCGGPAQVVALPFSA